MNTAQPVGTCLLTNLQSSISNCLVSYGQYVQMLHQNRLYKEYGWHNRIWTIHDVEAPASITNLVLHLELERKLFFAALENGIIRLTDALYSISLYEKIWQNALDKNETNATTHVYIYKMISAGEELNHALARLTKA
ncbi:MAG: hypothetical protein V5804_05660 [Mucilaginibacter sp.]|uniref:hypothetical protein n=1 Tax=Mucilaginibacter sp. TaxID=1882438 RepID=UPI0034E40756